MVQLFVSGQVWHCRHVLHSANLRKTVPAVRYNLRRQDRPRPDDRSAPANCYRTERIVPLVYSAMFSDGGVTDHLNYDVSLEASAK